MSRLSRLGPVGTRTVGAGVAAGSLAVLLLYPYYMRYHYAVPAAGRSYAFAVLAMLLAFVWAPAAAWGVATAVRGRFRSLTPSLACVAVPLAPLPVALDTFRRPRTDVVPTPEYITEWTPPSGPVELAVRTFETADFWWIGCVLFFVAGVAWARCQRRWLLGSFVALVCYGGAYGAVTTTLFEGLLVRPLFAMPVGAVLFAAGAKLAAKPDETTTDTAAARVSPDA
ncbi:hypothetical protein [Halosimplex marinum]|uniref:hypothetical protein n=1 Tax=Halosimplex marinum TaxID=3396620 RepID=UPI003F57C760